MGDLVIIANPDKPDAVRFAEDARDELGRCGCRAVLSLDLADDLSRIRADMAVVFGGDGTVLGAVQRFGDEIPPILAFNVGRLGYLADNPPGGIMETISLALGGGLAESRRMTLDARVLRDGGDVWRGGALNEFVLSARLPGRIVPLAVSVDDEDVMYTRGDGIIVATPTGSTAYALSAGGPVASPELQAVIVAPICPHQLANRPMVLGPSETIRLRQFGEDRAELAADGMRRFHVAPGDVVEVRASTRTVRLLSPPRGRFKVLRQKLDWGWRGERERGGMTAAYNGNGDRYEL
ncbi:MAG: NAD(+)/NADH kinase [Planctomycetota bacterium]|nr:NAD(+)/NADH kinase [Planctomycetota bacterium]